MLLLVKESETRWERLKATYFREKMIENTLTRSGAAASTRRKWEFFDRMKQLLERNFSRPLVYIHMYIKDKNMLIYFNVKSIVIPDLSVIFLVIDKHRVRKFDSENAEKKEKA